MWRIELTFHAVSSQEPVTRTFSFSALREDGFHGSCIQLFRCHENLRHWKDSKVIINSDRRDSRGKIQSYCLDIAGMVMTKHF